MFEETGLFVRLTALVGIFGGPEFVIHYGNGHRTLYVMAVFEAEHRGGTLHPDGAELLEIRFVSEAEAAALPKAPWVPEVLQQYSAEGRLDAFRRQEWNPPPQA